MNPLRTIWFKLRSLGQRRAVKQEIDEELRFHIEQRTTENIAAGMSPAEAAREARKRFGNLQSVREECRDVRGAAFSETVIQDVRFGARLLRKNPGFTTAVLLTMALGIGSVSSVFSIVQGVLLKSPPYPKPEQIVLISSVKAAGEPYPNGTTAAQWWEWQRQAKSFSAMAAYNPFPEFVILADGVEALAGINVTRDFFSVMGIQPLIGRAFEPSDFPPTDAPEPSVVILGYEVWQRRFHGDTNIIGKVIHRNFDTAPVTVVGVMPPGVRGFPSAFGSRLPGYDANGPVDVWSPNSGAPKSFGPKANYWSVVGRLRDGSGLAAAQAELSVIAARHAKEDPTFEGITPKAELLIDSVHADTRRLLVPLSGAVALVFLLACGSVAGLLVARGVQRHREYAVRCALGAGRWRIARQCVVENLILALAGGVLGAGLAAATVKVLKTAAGAAIPRLDDVTVGWPTLACCFAAALLAALVAGIAPALRAARLNAAAAKARPAASASRGDRGLLACIAIAQTALTLVLLASAALLIRTAANLAQVRPGYDTERIVAMTVTMVRDAQPHGIATNGTWLQRYMDFHERVLAQAPTLPGVKSAAWVYGVPLSGDVLTAVVQMNGVVTSDKFKDQTTIPVRAVTREYFDTLGLPLVAGRNLATEEESRTNAYMAVINQAMARRYFPNTDPVGKMFRMAFRNGPGGITRPFSDAQIVGVAADSREAALTRKAEPEFYISYWQVTSWLKSLVVRTAGDPGPVIASLQKMLRTLDPAIVIQHVKTIEQLRADSIAPQLFSMRLLTGFSLVAGALALIGIYGVLSLSVASRRQEMAIRMAVGAQRRNVLGLILGEGLRLVAMGVAFGAAAAVASTRVLRALLFGVEPTDLFTMMVAALLFMAVAALACYFPARRATQIDPMEALRYE
jgi:putative ABC transport system permease protein